MCSSNREIDRINNQMVSRPVLWLVCSEAIKMLRQVKASGSKSPNVSREANLKSSGGCVHASKTARDSTSLEQHIWQLHMHEIVEVESDERIRANSVNVKAADLSSVSRCS